MDNTRPHSKLYAVLSSPVKILTKSRDPHTFPPAPSPSLFQFLSFRNATQMRTMLDNGRKEIEK